MAKIKYYTEDELVQKVQSGEFGWLDYVNHHSKQWRVEYCDYCVNNGLQMGEESAEAFVDYKGNQLEEALAEGNA